MHNLREGGSIFERKKVERERTGPSVTEAMKYALYGHNDINYHNIPQFATRSCPNGPCLTGFSASGTEAAGSLG